MAIYAGGRNIASQSSKEGLTKKGRGWIEPDDTTGIEGTGADTALAGVA
jgi:hypothetical protein